ncbi:hypothetical protein GRI40_10870 [Altererythrobacter aerius]|uniref:Uncharacterized protein n=1 Tax=Tsuneonella aeria TaxID=1837929 RepID=A0A6I4TI49_9SPHN|nr:hypothetical protein [Tsuneonella aeria]MXO75720.1 hypothetical protein [Tsuneonella aeria]
MDERGSNEQDRIAPDMFGALVGWSHENLGDKVMVKLQSTRTHHLEPDGPLDEFRYFMTKNQAVVLANYLYSISDRLPQPRQRRWRWFR